MEKRFVISVCLLLFFMGALFVTQSITGLYSWDRYNNFCNADSDCSAGSACCFFFEESYGVCGVPDACESVLSASREEKSQFSVLQPPSPDVERELLFSAVRPHVEKPSRMFTYESLLVGLILISCAVIVYLLVGKEGKRSKK